jgi:hypothetical protein
MQEGDTMRTMTMRTKAAVTIAGATALATGAIAPADAQIGTGTVGHHAPALEMRGTLNPAVFHAFLDRKLDAAQTWAETMHAKAAAIPSATVLSGVERKAAKRRLASVVAAERLLASIPTTGPYAATAAERAQIADIQATLAATAATLTSLLANAPVAVTPTTFTKPNVRTVALAKVLGFRDARWLGWNGSWDGRHDGDRVAGERGDRHHCDH